MTTAREATVHLADLLRREHHALADFLIALSGFDRERRWVELGYASLFYFLTRELGLPNGPAFYRKTAAELLQRYPDLAEPLRDGRLNLTSVVELSKVITPENRGEVVPRFFGASKREAKEVVAELRPVPSPPLRTLVTSVRAPEVATDSGGRAAAFTTGALLPEEVSSCQLAATDGASGMSPLSSMPASAPVPPAAVLNSAAVPPAAPLPAPGPARRRTDVEPLTADLRRIHLTAPKRFLEKLAAARDALSHSHPGASDDQVLELGLDLIVDRHHKRRGIGTKPRKPTRAPEAPAATDALVSSSSSSLSPCPVPLPSRRSRHVPAAVRRAVWERDQGRCVWPVEGGGVCGSTHRLELDHVDGFALGGATTPDRCRLLCRVHQDIHARALYGDDTMNRFTRPKHGDRCSEPVAVYGAPAAAAPSCAPPSGGAYAQRTSSAIACSKPASSGSKSSTPRAASTPMLMLLSRTRSEPEPEPDSTPIRCVTCSMMYSSARDLGWR